MTFDNRVVWSEGMFLRTQHFQQQDRYIEGLVRSAVRGLGRHGWGISSLSLDVSALALGKIAVGGCTGVLPDGTPFAIPDQADHPPPLELGDGAREGIVYLALPMVQDGAIEFDRPEMPATGARYLTREVEVQDAVAGANGRAPIEIGRPRFKLLHESEERGAYVCLGVCRVAGVQTDGTIVLDKDYIPACLDVGASEVLRRFLHELGGLLASIAEARVGYITGRRAHGLGDITDFLVLQLANRAAPVVAHLARDQHLHPEQLFRFLLGLAGEASTFLGPSHRPIELPEYRHDDPAQGFGPLIREVQRLLIELARPDPRSVQVPLKAHRTRGVFTAEVQDRSLYSDATFVLAINAALAADKIRENFPRQVTIGPAEELSSMVTRAIRGIPLRHLPTVPREIPLHRGMLYFELDRSDPYWRKLPASIGLALHVSDVFPELELECWAIRD